MTEFLLVLGGMVVLWPVFFAAFFGTAAWIAFGVKSLFSTTSIELVRDDRDATG